MRERVLKVWVTVIEQKEDAQKDVIYPKKTCLYICMDVATLPSLSVI